MRLSAISLDTGEPLPKSDYDISILPPNTPPPVPPVHNAEGKVLSQRGIQFMFMPRIRCNDCPGKVYNAIRSDIEGVGFEVHLSKNRRHTENVERRLAEERAGMA